MPLSANIRTFVRTAWIDTWRGTRGSRPIVRMMAVRLVLTVPILFGVSIVDFVVLDVVFALPVFLLAIAVAAPLGPIRGDARLAPMRLVLATSIPTKDLRSLAADAGIDCVLSKPVRQSILIARLVDIGRDRARRPQPANTRAKA